MNYKVIIAGGRKFNDYNTLKKVCDYYLKNKDNIEIVSGMALGADKLGVKYANEHNYKLKEFPADWNDLSEPCFIKVNKYGKKYNAIAGHNRNEKMAQYADALILFWDGKSTGSKDMLDRAQKHNLEIRKYIYE